MPAPKFSTCTACGAPIEVRQVKKVQYCAGCKVEKAREAKRKYCAENPEKERERKRKYCAENAEKERERQRKWHAENAEKEREKKRAQNCRKAAARNHITMMILMNQLEKVQNEKLIC